MKRSIYLLTLIVCVAASTAFAQDEKTDKTETKAIAFFDMENCDICKSMSIDKDMMQQIKWETHLIPTGSLSIAVVPDSLKEQMAGAKKKMKAAVKKFEAGEKMTCCGYCTGMGELLAAGADLKELSTVGGDITTITSTDPKVVEEIHSLAKKTIEECEKMKEQMSKVHGE